MKRALFCVFCFLLIISTEVDFDILTDSEYLRPSILLILFSVSVLLCISNLKLPLPKSFCFYVLLLYLGYLSINMLLTPSYEGKSNSLVGVYVCFLFSLVFSFRFSYEDIVRYLVLL